MPLVLRPENLTLVLTTGEEISVKTSVKTPVEALVKTRVKTPENILGEVLPSSAGVTWQSQGTGSESH